MVTLTNVRIGNNKQKQISSSSSWVWKVLFECLIIPLVGRNRRQRKERFLLLLFFATVLFLFTYQQSVIVTHHEHHQQQQQADKESYAFNSKKTVQLQRQQKRLFFQPDQLPKNQIDVWRENALAKCNRMAEAVSKQKEWDQSTKRIKQRIEEEIVNRKI